jgi:hypothetical protein
MPDNLLYCAPLMLSQGFAALLEPFYGGKKLTDPIDTAKVRKLRWTLKNLC